MATPRQPWSGGRGAKRQVGRSRAGGYTAGADDVAIVGDERHTGETPDWTVNGLPSFESERSIDAASRWRPD
jgi:hypothetical protein